MWACFVGRRRPVHVMGRSDLLSWEQCSVPECFKVFIKLPVKMKWSKGTWRQRTGCQVEFKRSHDVLNRTDLFYLRLIALILWVAKKWNHTFTWFSCNLCVSLIPLIKYHYCFADFISFWFCFSSLNHTIVLCWFWVLVPMVTVRFCNSKGQLCLKEAWTFPMCLEIDCTILDKVIIKIFLSSFTFRLSFVPNAGFLLGHKHPLFIPCW